MTKKVITFVVLYVAQTGTLWGLLEGYTYFKGDTLKNFLGIFWVLIYIIPLFTTIYVIANASKDEEAVNTHIKTEGDFSPGQVDGNYSIRKPLKAKKSRKSDSANVKDNNNQLSESMGKTINTKGDYSPGEVKGDYTIEG